MKFCDAMAIHGAAGRSREGAWIEIKAMIGQCSAIIVAPARERGLKSLLQSIPKGQQDGRSREGAWIEIRPMSAQTASAD